MQEGIINFIKENKIATICCTDKDNTPYCFHCFYAFDERNHLLFFKSSSQTLHSTLLAENPIIAGSILPDKNELLSLKGIQLTGKVLYGGFPEYIKPETFYHKKFPFALAKPGDVWCIELTMVKMTDNTNIFGKKLKWEKYEHA
ncbi:hypothetical protein LK994_11190 [Ferruginibacter lapsinanis]|uniref:pyridoxamine 5'-phosphate oxidase family protein n=1 Tax=Ferruginibacter lapsinanis TaxID=563172 RepID=UPI001E64032C|nr:pyridoxamine 5'-phosphate oxidase family protein [Ferruginibacter lapsinanis]UEG49195.1 hypothetical protein LK994_11190 [Ferruginibacter lapsinanis]